MEILQNLINVLLEGGPGAISALLLIIILGLLWDRRELKSQLAKKDEKINQLIQDYYDGSRTMTDALNGIKSVLTEIKSRF